MTRRAFLRDSSLLAALAAGSPRLFAAKDGSPGPSAVAQAVADATNKFGVNLYKQVDAEKEGNLFFSPYSIATALAMVNVGARGKTAAEIKQVLQLKGDQKMIDRGFSHLAASLNADGKQPYDLNVANAIWMQKDYQFVDSFIETLTQRYAAGAFDVDFIKATEPSRKRINDWVEEQTKEKITDLMPQGSITGDTRLVLTNAIYFKGTWQSVFNKKATRPMPFMLAGGKQAKADMMYQSTHFRHLDGESFAALDMPYKGGDLSMVVLLPKKNDGLAQLEKDMTAGKVDLDATLAKVSKQRAVKVNTWLPRFKTTMSISLKKTLSALGMPTAFGRGADFSGINGSRDLHIQAVMHKAYVDVNEEGTEAAAATGISVGRLSIEVDPPVVFKADHPFVYVIKDNRTDAALFVGRVMDPTKKE